MWYDMDTVRPRKNETENYRCFIINIITVIINKWHIFVKLDPPLSFDATHTMHIPRMSDLKKIEERTLKSHLTNGIWISKRITFLESSFSSLLYGTSIRKNEPGITIKFHQSQSIEREGLSNASGIMMDWANFRGNNWTTLICFNDESILVIPIVCQNREHFLTGEGGL